MRKLVTGLVTATLFLGCQLDTGEGPPVLVVGGDGGSGATTGVSGASAGTTSGSGGSSAGSVSNAGRGGRSGSAGASGSNGTSGSDNAGSGGSTQAGGSGPAGGRGGSLGGAGSGGRSAQAGSSGSATAGTSSGGSAGSGGCTENIGCTLDPLPSTGDPYQDCVDRINQFRTECACLPALARWTEGEGCADEMSEYDSVEDEAHAGFRDDICDGGSAQNECPGWRSETQVIEGCLQMMWDEGPPPQDPCEGDCFQEHGHFINMTNERYTKVACGFYTTDGNEVWAVQNFTR